MTLTVFQMKEMTSLLLLYLPRTCLHDLIPVHSQSRSAMGDDGKGRGLLWCEMLIERASGEILGAKLRMVSANGHNMIRSCIYDIFFDVTK